MPGKGDALILLAAFLSFVLSVSLWFGFGMPADKDAGVFVGLWVPSILATGIYFQLIARRQSNGR
jgi:hypothetical protein